MTQINATIQPAITEINATIHKGSISEVTGGEANTSSNVGTGAGLAKTKVGVDLPFKSLIFNGASVTENTNDITIDINSIEVTHSELLVLMSASGLLVGQKYTITDYITVYDQPVTNLNMSASAIEPLIVTAISTSEINHIAYSTLYSTDIIYYNINNIATYSTTTARKGFIYRRIETRRNIDICYDWRNVKFRRYACNESVWSAGTYSQGDIYIGSDNYVYISLEDSNTDNPVGSTTWAKFLDINHTEYWGCENSATEEGVSFDTSDYIDVFTFADLSDSTNSSGIITDGVDSYEARNIYIEGINAENTLDLFSNPTTYIYLNNVMYMNNDDMYTNSSYYGSIFLKGNANFDEGNEFTYNNTFYKIGNVEINGHFTSNKISRLFFSVNKNLGHATCSNNYIIDFTQTNIDGLSDINSNKIYLYQNNSHNNGGCYRLSCNSLQLVQFNGGSISIVYNNLIYNLSCNNISTLINIGTTTKALLSTTYPKEIYKNSEGNSFISYYDSGLNEVKLLVTD